MKNGNTLSISNANWLTTNSKVWWFLHVCSLWWKSTKKWDICFLFEGNHHLIKSMYVGTRLFIATMDSLQQWIVKVKTLHTNEYNLILTHCVEGWCPKSIKSSCPILSLLPNMSLQGRSMDPVWASVNIKLSDELLEKISLFLFVHPITCSFLTARCRVWKTHMLLGKFLW